MKNRQQSSTGSCHCLVLTNTNQTNEHCQNTTKYSASLRLPLECTNKVSLEVIDEFKSFRFRVTKRISFQEFKVEGSAGFSMLVRVCRLASFVGGIFNRFLVGKGCLGESFGFVQRFANVNLKLVSTSSRQCRKAHIVESDVALHRPDLKSNSSL